MEPGTVFRPSYKNLHREMAKRRGACERAVSSLKDQSGVYAEEIRRCQRMYERVLAAIEIDKPDAD